MSEQSHTFKARIACVTLEATATIVPAPKDRFKIAGVIAGNSKAATIERADLVAIHCLILRALNNPRAFELGGGQPKKKENK